MDDTAKFRAELIKIMPGYKWTIHRSNRPNYARATGVMSSGFNRLSTLEVRRQENEEEGPWYLAALAGNGKRAEFGEAFGGKTLAQALRDLQGHYEREAAKARSRAERLKAGRKIDAGGPTFADEGDQVNGIIPPADLAKGGE